MPINLANLPAQRQDFLTSRNAAWLDGYPVVGTPAIGGVAAGLGNVGTGALKMKAIDSGAEYGVHVVNVTSVANGTTFVSVTNPDGNVTGQGVVGIPFYAGGLTLEVDPGPVAYVVNDTFAISVAPQPLDLTGLQFQLLAYRPPSAASLWLTGDNYAAGGLVSGGYTGTLANVFGRSVMSKLDTGEYPYNVLASDPASPDTPVVVFFGTIIHDALIRASS